MEGIETGKAVDTAHGCPRFVQAHLDSAIAEYTCDL